MSTDCLNECQELVAKILKWETDKSDRGESTTQDSAELDSCQVKKPKTSANASNLAELQEALMAKMKHAMEEMKLESDSITNELTNFQMKQVQKRIGDVFEDKDECCNEIEAL